MSKGAFDRRLRLATPLSKLVVLSLFIFGWVVFAARAQDQQPRAVLFEDVRIFDGKSAGLSGPTNVLIRGNKIEKISTAPIPVDRTSNTRTINGGGRTLMPGLIDMHWHTMFVRPSHSEVLVWDLGFTTVRDMGGSSFGLKRAIDDGVVPGPRIFPSGAMITITGGHGDFRQLFEVPRILGGPLTRMEQEGATMVADSPDEVRVRVREQLMLGATQIKLSAGGGVASPHSPLDASTFTEPELRAAVEAAENWGTYVTVHAYTPASIQRAISA